MESIAAPSLTPDETQRVGEAISRYWGFPSLRPLQESAIAAALRGRDSLTVLPTGGGKSLCYQVPPLLSDCTDVVVSPLISLMKDQVDGLKACGCAAAAIHSGMSAQERRDVEGDLTAGRLRLVFAAPERLLTDPFLRLLDRLQVCRFAIDEAHCISHWGHDFRPEYRRIAELRERFPKSSIHAFTATATQRVRKDIVQQLRLRDAVTLVGSFDRPNLIYRVVPRIDLEAQVLEAVRRHAGEAVIIYCLSRRDTEDLADFLREQKVSAAAYHAGLDAQLRRTVQDAFAAEKLDVVVATVAFGMGIDRSNVRCVAHACIPKSIEHYQQETGRAGRDSLPAECVLFYSASDVMRWESLIEKSAEEADRPQEVIASMSRLLQQMQHFCNVPRCRHRALVEYFGQQYPRENCEACDVCLAEAEEIKDSTTIARKILSCVARVEQRFGVGHVVDVLVGTSGERIRDLGHDKLSTFGLLAATPRRALKNLIYQLIDQDLLVRTADDKPVLKLNEASWEVMRGQRQVRLIQPKEESLTATSADQDGWAGVDRGLFESLRALRRDVAERRSVPAFVIFSDNTLRHMARLRPSSLTGLSRLLGVGEQKLADFGAQFVHEIVDHCKKQHLSMDNKDVDAGWTSRPKKRRKRTQGVRTADQMFAKGCSIEQVVAATGRARSTAYQYLAEYIEAAAPPDIDRWVSQTTYRLVEEAARTASTDRLKPIFERLGGTVPYEDIRLVLAHRRALTSRGTPSA